MTATALFFVAAFEVYGASMSGTKVLEAGMCRWILRDGAMFVHIAQPPAAADAAIIPHSSLFARSSLHSLQLGLPFISYNPYRGLQ